MPEPAPVVWWSPSTGEVIAPVPTRMVELYRREVPDDAVRLVDPLAPSTAASLGAIDTVLALVRRELVRATAKFGSFASAHEGYAVILEEVDELWDEVKANRPERATEEAVQVAAMGARFLLDLGVFPESEPPVDHRPRKRSACCEEALTREGWCMSCTDMTYWEARSGG